MRKIVLALALVGLFSWTGCQKNQGNDVFTSDYTPDSIGLSILTDLSERIPEMNPEEEIVMAKSDDFTLTNKDIFPLFLRSIQAQNVDLSQIPVNTIVSVIGNMVKQEAERILLYNEAKNQKINIGDEKIETTLEEIYTGYGSKENFEKMIAESGFTLKDVRRDQLINLTIEGLINKIIGNSVEVSEEDIQQILNSDKTATVRHILFLTQGKSDDEKSAILKKAQDVMTKAKNGEDFAALVKAHSEDPGSADKGGLYEKFPRGRMVPSFEEASFNLPIGSISDVVETSYGYHIIKIESREKETRSYEDVKTELKNTQGQGQKQQAFTEEIERLTEAYHLEVVYGKE